MYVTTTQSDYRGSRVEVEPADADGVWMLRVRDAHGQTMVLLILQPEEFDQLYLEVVSAVQVQQEQGAK